MTREQAQDYLKGILGEDPTKEQIDNLLINVNKNDQEQQKQIENLNKQIESLTNENKKYSDYDAIKKQLDDINKANMSEQEKLEEMKKEVEKNLRDSRITKNKAKALEILAGENVDEDILSSLVSEDLDITISKATKMKETFNNLREATSKKTKEDLLNIDAKPNIENKVQTDSGMTMEKFNTLSAEEQNKFAEENPELFEKL